MNYSENFISADDEGFIDLIEDDDFDDDSYIDASYELAAAEEDDDWEAWDDDDDADSENLTERRRRWRRYRSARGRRYISRPSKYRAVSRVRSGYIKSRSGQRTPINFRAPMAKASSVDSRFKEIKSEYAKLSGSVNKLFKKMDKNTSILDKKINSLNADTKKSLQQSQQTMLLPLLLQSKPELTKIELKQEGKEAIEFDVSDQEFKKSDNNLPLLLMMSGMGGSTNNNSMMMMALASGAFK